MGSARQGVEAHPAGPQGRLQRPAAWFAGGVGWRRAAHLREMARGCEGELIRTDEIQAGSGCGQHTHPAKRGGQHASGRFQSVAAHRIWEGMVTPFESCVRWRAKKARASVASLQMPR